MKHLPHRLMIIIVAGGCALVLAVAAYGETSSTSHAKQTGRSAAVKQYVVGFSNPTAAQPILATFQNALVAAGKKLNIKVVSIDAALNVEKQVSDIDDLIAEHVNGIIVFPLAPATLTPALDRARKAGIKVLGFNAVVQKPKNGASIAPYNANFDQGEDYQGAKLLAQYVSKQLHGSGNVLGIGIATPVPSLHFMVAQYQTYLKQLAPKVKWLETVSNATDDIAGGETVAAEAATRYAGKINAVMAYNDDSAIGAAIALKNAGVKNPIIVGQNGDPEGVAAIEDGQMSAMVDIVPWREALVAATMMNDLLTGKSVPDWVATPDVMYTKSNIGQRLSWTKAVQEISNGTLSCKKGGGCPSSIVSPG
jgi:ribose transport system substrate-binding protein